MREKQHKLPGDHASSNDIPERSDQCYRPDADRQ